MYSSHDLEQEVIWSSDVFKGYLNQLDVNEKKASDKNKEEAIKLEASIKALQDKIDSNLEVRAEFKKMKESIMKDSGMRECIGESMVECLMMLEV